MIFSASVTFQKVDQVLPRQLSFLVNILSHDNGQKLLVWEVSDSSAITQNHCAFFTYLVTAAECVCWQCQGSDSEYSKMCIAFLELTARWSPRIVSPASTLNLKRAQKLPWFSDVPLSTSVILSQWPRKGILWRPQSKIVSTIQPIFVRLAWFVWLLVSGFWLLISPDKIHYCSQMISLFTCWLSNSNALLNATSGRLTRTPRSKPCWLHLAKGIDGMQNPPFSCLLYAHHDRVGPNDAENSIQWYFLQTWGV